MQVSIVTTMDASELLGALSDRTVCGGWHDGAVLHLYWPARHWQESKSRQLREMMVALEGAGDPKITVTTVSDEDWNAKWAESVESISVGNRIHIRPSWKPISIDPETIDIILDPKQAFGTGHHATTQLLIEWLESVVHGGERIVDIGTGSGLLAMVALRLGAATALGIDNDPIAIECARSYASLNGFGPELELRVEHIGPPTLQSQEQFDIIVANIDGNTFRSHASDILSMMNKGGRLYISGLLEEDEQEISTLFLRHGALPLGSRMKDGWVALGFHVRMNLKK